MHIAALLGGSLLALLCSFTFSYTFCGSAASSLLSLFFCGYFHFLCPFSPHPKHFASSLTISCLLTSFTPHCITQLFSTSNLFPTAVFFFFSSPLLHFWARCLNLPQCLHSLPSLLSSSALSLARARLSLSISLMSWLYWFRDIALCSRQVVIKKVLYICWEACRVLHLSHLYVYWSTRSSPSQVPTAVLTTALILG